ncbi:MAG: ABC transporter ATP-binding protein [Caldilineaceae bacterium SB0664_bin_27]|uniref:ABC transporter ATP-binding protein n=1 Tax=Caldilineaceae bacterium SB0664_bin_27 TaxID=2605260 RepID=A0A6B0YQ93_9CHLR|nr:ABC transporter ATP-binding protein [Caldilineaceae bacterium SB0664_bin_27]
MKTEPPQQPKARADVYRRLIGFLRPYWKQAAFAYFSVLFGSLLNLYIPQILKDAIDQGIEGQRAGALFTAAGWILGIAVVRGVAAYGQRYYGEWLTHRVAYDLRNQFYNATQRLPFAFHDRSQTGDMMSRATSDITETERFVGMGLMDLTASLLLLGGVIVVMVLESFSLALYALIPLSLLLVLTLRFGMVIRPRFKRVQEQMGQLSSTMQESMTGIQVVKAFARETDELRKFNAANEDWFAKRFGIIKIWANNWPTFTFILLSSNVLLLFVGGPLAIEGAITIGSLFAMLAYVMMLNGPVQRLGFLVNMAATSGASATRVFEIIDTPAEVEEQENPIVLKEAQGAVTFEGVSFGYEGGPRALDDISFEVESGQTVALIGPTGSGKSTITNLIPRFYDPASGSIRIDGHDLRGLTLDSLRRHVGIVLQDPFLFGVTIAENIAYGVPEATPDAIVAAAKAARAHDFIMEFPAGYETVVGERGVTLSGGQKQRVAIARALLYEPRILILDDSTSSVDTETEHLIQQALNSLMEGRTTFVIAQRLLTLKNADQILVLDGGRIVERGRHDELLTAGGLYRNIYDLQLRDQEEFAELEARLQDQAESEGTDSDRSQARNLVLAGVVEEGRN